MVDQTWSEHNGTAEQSRKGQRAIEQTKHGQSRAGLQSRAEKTVASRYSEHNFRCSEVPRKKKLKKREKIIYIKYIYIYKKERDKRRF